MSFQLISLSREEVGNINSIVCKSGNQLAAEQIDDAIKENNEDKFAGILMDVLHSIQNTTQRDNVISLLKNSLKRSTSGKILSISEHSSSLGSFLVECNDLQLWECFVHDLVDSFYQGSFDYHSHGEMLNTSSLFDNNLSMITKAFDFIQNKELPFLFMLMPHYVLTFHSSSFISGLLQCKDKNMAFYSHCYPKYQEYSSWFMAGLHRFLKTPGDPAPLLGCLTQLPPHSPFFMNLTPLDLQELYRLYLVHPSSIETLLTHSSNFLSLLCIHLIQSDVSKLPSILQQCFQYQTKPTLLLKQILSTMSTLKCFNNLSALLAELPRANDQDYSDVISSFVFHSPQWFKCLRFVHFANAKLLLACCRGLFYARQPEDQNQLIRQILGECMRDSTQICVLADALLKVYFDGSSDIFENDPIVLQQRECVDSSFALVLDTIASIGLETSLASILEDLWRSRLNPSIVMTSPDPYGYQLACYPTNAFVTPIYSYGCLQRLLEMTVLTTGPNSLPWYVPLLSTTLRYVLATRLQLPSQQKKQFKLFLQSVIHTVSKMSAMYTRVDVLQCIVPAATYSVVVSLVNFCYGLTINIHNNSLSKESFKSSLTELLNEANVDIENNQLLICIIRDIVRFSFSVC